MCKQYALIRRAGVIGMMVLCYLAISAMTAVADEHSLWIPDSTQTQIVSLKDGSTLVGRITEIGDDEVTIQTSAGSFTVAKEKIADVKLVESSAYRDGVYWFPNPNRTRLYVGPTGRCLRKGEGYFSDMLIFFPSVSYGLTDNVTIGGGMSLVPGIDFDRQLFYLMPKIGLDVKENIAIAASAIIIQIPDFDDDDDEDGDLVDLDEGVTVGVLFASSTIGTDDKSLTLGLGFGFADDEIADNPAVLVGGEYRVARRLSLVTENWIFPEVDDPLISYGVRFFGEQLSIDLALFNILNDDAIFPGFPFVGFVWNF
ncbi:MAG: hypothetical protein JW763_00005 [candidate division Zixibacteria bacterium]|nr:hypothetical protein [candidate division Zixibacteria bacterium]